MGKILAILGLCLVVLGGGYGAAAYIFAPEDLTKGTRNNTPVLTISTSCITCIEQDLKEINGLKHVVIGSAEKAIDLSENANANGEKTLQIYFEPHNHSTKQLVDIFTKSVLKQNKYKRAKWRYETGYDLVFYTENNKQTSALRKILRLTNSQLSFKEAIKYDIRPMGTFVMADVDDQKFFNTYIELEKVQAAQKAGQKTYQPRMSKLQELKNKEDSIFNLNKSE